MLTSICHAVLCCVVNVLFSSQTSHSNTRTEDLWAAFSAATNNEVDIGALMTDWVTYSGHPLLTVTRVASDDAKVLHAHLNPCCFVVCCFHYKFSLTKGLG